MGDDPPVFLTEKRREVLNGTYNGEDSTRRYHETMIRARCLVAVEELIEVARSPYIDNWDAFNAETLGTLIDLLVYGTGGLSGDLDDDLPDQAEALSPDPDFAREVYHEVDVALHGQPEKDVPE